MIKTFRTDKFVYQSFLHIERSGDRYDCNKLNLLSKKYYGKEITMNEFLRLERAAKRYKEQYPEGTRIELISMNDSQAVPPGTRGTVNYVDDLGTIHMNWDNGRTLGICPQEDSFRKLTEQELEEEHMEKRSRIVGKSTSLTTDSGYGCFEGYTTSNKWNGWQCPLFNKENADKICKAYNNEFCQMRYDEENDCYIADYPVDEYTENYKGGVSI